MTEIEWIEAHLASAPPLSESTRRLLARLLTAEADELAV